jgi:CHAT domain-containing protein
MKNIVLMLLWLLSVNLYGQTIEEKYLDYELRLGDAYEDGDYLQSLAIAKEMEQVFGHIDSFLGVALSDQALIYTTLDDYEQAEVLYTRAIPILKRSVGEAHEYYGNALNNLAILYEELGSFEQAEPLYKLTLDIELKHNGKDVGYSIALGNLAELYRQTGKNAKAKEFLHKSLDIQEKLKKVPWFNYTIGLSNLALLYQDEKDYKMAEICLLKAAALQQQHISHNRTIYAYTLSYLANLYINMEKYDLAERYAKEALAIRIAILGAQSPQSFKIFFILGRIERGRKNLVQAEQYFLRALKMNLKDTTKAIDFNRPEAMDFVHLDEALSPLGGCAASYYSYFLENKDLLALEKAYKIFKFINKLQNELLQAQDYESDKLRNLSKNKDDLDWLLMLGNVMPNKKELYADWFGYIEQNKSVLLKQAMNNKKARNFGDLPDSLARRERKLEQTLKQLYNEKSQLLTAEEAALINEKIQKTQYAQTIFKREIKDKYPRYYALKYDDQPASVAQVQAALGAGDLFLEYFVADTVVYLFAVHQKQLQVYTFAVPKKVLKQRVAALHQSLSDYSQLINEPEAAYKNYTENAFWLYQNILAPALADAPQCRRLIISTDGDLGLVPFEALLSAPPAANVPYNQLPYLLNQYTISYNYSATLWLENLTNKKKENKGQILAIAADYTQPTPEFRSARIATLRKALKPLPSVKKEVEGIAELFKGSFWLDTAATEANFKSKAADYAVIHLAMHGLLDGQNYTLSSLAFSESKDSTQDNLLEVWEISQMQLAAELVVLSACETGQGLYHEGEGVMSLARAFMYAGAPAVVMSLWQVNDQSTQLLMQFFYIHLESGLDKAEALRQAKIEYIAAVNSKAAHPAFWAAFVQLGDSAPVLLNGKKTTYGQYILYSGIALLALLLALLYFRYSRKK